MLTSQEMVFIREEGAATVKPGVAVPHINSNIAITRTSHSGEAKVTTEVVVVSSIQDITPCRIKGLLGAEVAIIVMR